MSRPNRTRGIQRLLFVSDAAVADDVDRYRHVEHPLVAFPRRVRDERTAYRAGVAGDIDECRRGIETGSIDPPPGGRAPGWHAGLALARNGRYSGVPKP